jgi:GNAT superfamily N-acetyltransferase
MRDKQGGQEYTIGNLEERDIEHLIPVLRRWIQKNGAVIEEEFSAVLKVLIENIEGRDKNVYLVARDRKGKAIGVMGFGEVNEKMIPFKTAPDSRAAGLLTAFIFPDCRGKGLGKSLMTALFERVAEAGWTEIIWSSNPRYRETAWRFYTHVGGQPVGLIDGLFEKTTKTPVWRKSL